jgi:hypothetical protein
MGITRDTLKHRIARIEQRQTQQVADAIAYLHHKTRLPVQTIIAATERLVHYYREHGEWPPALVAALQSDTTGETRIILRWDGQADEPPEDDVNR